MDYGGIRCIVGLDYWWKTEIFNRYCYVVHWNSRPSGGGQELVATLSSVRKLAAGVQAAQAKCKKFYETSPLKFSARRNWTEEVDYIALWRRLRLESLLWRCTHLKTGLYRFTQAESLDANILGITGMGIDVMDPDNHPSELISSYMRRQRTRCNWSWGRHWFEQGRGGTTKWGVSDSEPEDDLEHLHW